MGQQFLPTGLLSSALHMDIMVFMSINTRASQEGHMGLPPLHGTCIVCPYNEAFGVIIQTSDGLKKAVGIPGLPVISGHHGNTSGIAMQGSKMMSLSQKHLALWWASLKKPRVLNAEKNGKVSSNSIIVTGMPLKNYFPMPLEWNLKTFSRMIQVVFQKYSNDQIPLAPNTGRMNQQRWGILSRSAHSFHWCGSGPAHASLEQQEIWAWPPSPQSCGQMDSGKSCPLAVVAGHLGLSLKRQVFIWKSKWNIAFNLNKDSIYHRNQQKSHPHGFGACQSTRYEASPQKISGNTGLWS